jgi:hypothetical protein
MNVTISRPGPIEVSPEHTLNDGRVMVSADGDDMYHALTLWISPAVAAQWIEALTPIAEARK